MRVSQKLFAGAAALAATAALAAAPAHALTVVPVDFSPFSLPSNPSGVIPVGGPAALPPGPPGWQGQISGSDTYDFPFATITGTYSVLMQMQASIHNGVTSTPQILAFTLWSGSPGSGSQIGSSPTGTTTPTLLKNLAPGSYYMEVVTSNSPTEFLTGGLTLFAVPEPATWAMLISGFGLLGLAARRRRTGAVAA